MAAVAAGSSRFVYLYGQNWFEDCADVWYRIDVDSLRLNKTKNDECHFCYVLEPQAIQLFPFSIMTFEHYGNWTIVDDDIYYVGGKEPGKGNCDPASRYLYKFNTKNPSSGWKVVSSSIKNPRSEPFFTSIGRKLYVFGGYAPIDYTGPKRGQEYDIDITDPKRGQVYDIDTGTWKEMELDVKIYGPYYNCNCELMKTKEGQPTKIVVFPSSLSSVHTNRWLFYDGESLHEEDHPYCNIIFQLSVPMRRATKPVMNNSTVYWFTYDLRLYAYDLVAKKWFCSKCLKEQLWTIQPGPLMDSPVLVDLYNGKMLLVVKISPGKLAAAILSVVKDKVSLNVFVESLHTLLVGSHFYPMTGKVM